MLRFKRIGKGEYSVFAGRKRVGSIRDNGRFVRTEIKYLDHINAFISGLNQR